MVRWQSRVNPRFLTVLEKGTVALPTIIESGSCKDVEILFDDTSIASVLSSLNFSLLIVIHDLTSSIHDCMESTRSRIREGGADC